jgi:hypothetical protein
MKQEATMAQSFSELIAQAEPPEWLVEIVERYRDTGRARPEDAIRVLGDPMKSASTTCEQGARTHFNVR